MALALIWAAAPAGRHAASRQERRMKAVNLFACITGEARNDRQYPDRHQTFRSNQCCWCSHSRPSLNADPYAS